jgi:N-acetylglucosamine-6-sulfatase
VIQQVRARANSSGWAPGSDRRRLAAAVAFALLAAGLLAAVGLPGTGPERAAAKKQGATPPNIIVIMADDQTLSAFRPDVMPDTFQLLVDPGTFFKNFVVTDSTCCPSRATFLTGQYAHNHGVLANNPGYLALKGEDNVLPVWLQQAGYTTAHIGKWLNKYGRAVGRNATPAPGWDQWVAALEPRRYYDYDLQVNGDTQSYGSRPRDYQTKVLEGYALKTISRYMPGRDNPLFMTFAPYAPHIQAGRGGDPTGRCAGAAIPGPHDGDLFASDPLPDKPSFNEENVDDKPTFIRRLPPLTFQDALDIQRRWGCQEAALRGVDRSVADIYNAVKQAGELNNTVFIYWSDNGLFYGEHRLPGEKQQAYEESIRTPLVIRAPGGGSQPSTVSAPTANIDLAPTILHYAGAQPCRKPDDCRIMDGRSLTPLLKGAGSGFPLDRHIVIEYRLQKDRSRRGSTCAYSGLWTPTESYTEYRRSVVHPDETRDCEPKLEYEHYDLVHDPFELDNLAYSANTDSTVPDPTLEPLLSKLRFCAGIEGRDPAPRTAYCE